MKKMNKSKYALISVIFILSILHFSTGSVMAGIINGDFSLENSGEWVTDYGSGSVKVLSDSNPYSEGNGFAVLYTDYEDESSVSILYQEDIDLSDLSPDQTQLSFDIEMSKPGGITETDIFTAILATGTHDSLNILKSYSLASSVLEDEYTYFKTVFFDLTDLMLSDTYTLYFQLENVPDGIDTSVIIDNIQFVPVPNTLLLGILGLFSIALWKIKAYRVSRI